MSFPFANYSDDYKISVTILVKTVFRHWIFFSTSCSSLMFGWFRSVIPRKYLGLTLWFNNQPNDEKYEVVESKVCDDKFKISLFTCSVKINFNLKILTYFRT